MCALALAGVLAQAFAPARPREASQEASLGVVEQRSNDVRRRSRGAPTWEELRGGEPVHEEDAVYAAEDSQAVILLGDGARIQLEESSLVVVRRKTSPESAATPALALELVRGGARGLAGGRTLEIRAGGSQVAVDGRGEVRVRRTGEGASVEVASGQALLASAGSALRLRQGQAVLSGAGGPRVVELAVTLTSPAPAASLSFRDTPPPVAFGWRPPRPDARCTLEVAATPDFASPVVHAVRTDGQLVHTGLGPGLYHWRVRCDEAGAERWSEQRALRIVADVPPVALRPLPGEVVDLSQGEVLSLAWSELPDEEGYRVELARDGDFSAPALSVTSHRAALRVARELSEGRYCFRVQAARGERPEAPWSAPSCFRVITRPLLEAPRTLQPRREPLPEAAPEKGAWLLELVLPAAHASSPQSALVLRWERVPGAVAYLLEIAEDRGFTRTVVHERVAEPYFRWKVIARRDYFWRVRAVDADGREGAVSDVSRIGSEVAPPTLETPAARAVDACGNAASGPAALAVVPEMGLLCIEGCGADGEALFTAGEFRGRLVLAATAPEVRLRMSSGAVSGESNAFEVVPFLHTPPLARLTRSVAVLRAGESLTLDASGSSDAETPAEALAVSWDPEGAATLPAPWSAWTVEKSLTHTFPTPGLFRARVVVRDPDGDIGYGAATVLVLKALDAPVSSGT